MSHSTFKLGLIQHACPTTAKPGETLAIATDLIRQAASQGATLIATQELFIGPYFCQIEDEDRFDLAEPVPDGPTTQHLQQLAQELGVALTGSLFEKRAPGVYHNTSVMIDRSGALVDRYRKMHIPDDPRFYEKYYFTPGDLGFRAQQVDGIHTGMLVCWDQWYPEAARLTALKGANILFYPTAIGWYHGETPEDKAQQKAAWQTIQKSHAIANGVYVAAINRIGTEDDLTFWGSSFVCDPGGTVIAQASPDQPEALVVEIDLSKIETWRRGWPFLRDRRIDAYAQITQRLID
ncbi:MAG: carbon-nitrogen hydrolase [Algisphaera sp.]